MTQLDTSDVDVVKLERGMNNEKNTTGAETTFGINFIMIPYTRYNSERILSQFRKLKISEIVHGLISLPYNPLLLPFPVSWTACKVLFYNN